MKTNLLILAMTTSILAVAQESRGACPASIVSAAEDYARSLPFNPNGANPSSYAPQCFAFTYGYHVSLQRGFGVPGSHYGCEVRVLVDKSGAIHDQLKLWDHPAGNPYGTNETSKRWDCSLSCDAWNDWCGQGPDYGGGT
jgi:hypothetical protein